MLREKWESFWTSKKVELVLVLLVFFLLQWVSYGLYFRVDISRAGRFRITESTKKILRNLPDTVILEAFISSEVPEVYVQQVKFIRDFLEEYARASDGKLKLILQDPDTDEEAKRRAQTLGLKPIGLGGVGTGELVVKEAYVGVAILYGLKSEIIEDATQVRRLEYELTAKIYKMVYPSERRIAFAPLGGGFSLRKEENPWLSLEILEKGLSTFYGDFLEVNLEEEEIPAEVKTLLLVEPVSLGEKAKFRIDQFLLRGGNIILALSGLKIEFSSGMGAAIEEKTLEFFRHYGVLVGKDFLFSPSYIPLRRAVTFFQVQEIPYPLWVLVRKEELSSQHLITKELPYLVYPWGSSLQPSGPQKEGWFPLVKTQKDTWVQKDMVFISPQVIQNVLQGEPPNRGEYVLAFYKEGKWKSFFTKNPLPKGVPPNFLKESQAKGRFLIIGSPFMLSDQGILLGRFVNLHFLLNALDYMNGFQDLLESRQKEVSIPPLPAIEESVKRAITLRNFILPVLVVMGMAFFFFYKRHKKGEKKK